VRLAGSPLWVLAAAVAAATGLGLYFFLAGSAAPGEGAAAGADIRVISKGEPVNLRDHLVPGKYTLFDYYADWCPPCRELAPRLEEMGRRHPNLAIRKIDIVDWSHPVADQQGVHDLPYLRLYGPDGRMIQEGDAALDDLQRLFGLNLSLATP
jgi:thiol-disulfide isomerase/thioredoxin